MTRINTNVPSIVAQQTLQRSNAELNEVLTRLSTGLRINTGKDDPAGLIASEVLRSDIISVERAITNSERANQLIATADSALGQVSGLLNDIRGLVSEAANTGALSEEQIAANQLQVDSSLEAVDRIAQTTVFQGRRLLDGSLDFLSTSSGTVDTFASGTYNGSGGVATTDTAAVFSLSDTGGNPGTVDITALSAGTAANAYSFVVTTGTGGADTSVTVTGGDTITVTLESGTAATADNVASAINADAIVSTLFSATVTNAGAFESATTSLASGTFNNNIVISATSGGVGYSGTSISLATVDAAVAVALSGGTIEIAASANATAAEIAAGISTLDEFTATAQGTGLGTLSAGTTTTVLSSATTGVAALDNLVIEQANFGTASQIAIQVDVDTQATRAQLNYSGGTLTGDLILEVGGSSGFEVFNFGSGTTIDQIETAIDLVSDSTGVEATVNGSVLELRSSAYGSDEFVSARALSGTFDAQNNDAASSTRESGTDVDLRINGVKATGDGLAASINTSTLDLSFNLASTVSDGDQLSFNITGGGAVFQLGPDVVSNQQARIGIRGVSSATLGGVEGTLFELRSGGAKSLANDATAAGKVVEEVITAVTSLRGRLGAFQKATLETNIFSLTEQLQNLTEAESSIRDADFAAESARLTRSQILVQSGTSVLSIANQNPQNVLALLR